MSNDFLYLKLKNKSFFENNIPPQKDNIILYTRKNNEGKIELVFLDENGKEQISSSNEDLENDLEQILINIVGHEISDSSESNNSNSTI